MALSVLGSCVTSDITQALSGVISLGLMLGSCVTSYEFIEIVVTSSMLLVCSYRLSGSFVTSTHSLYSDVFSSSGIVSFIALFLEPAAG